MLQRLQHMLGIESLTAEQITFILDQSKPFQEFQRHPLKKLATLRGKTVAVAFFESSTRTRISFTTAASRLGADTMNLQAESSSLKKGESLLDTVRTLEAMRPDGIVMRHSSSGAAAFVASALDIPVLNAGDGTHEHPTQALLDALTIRDAKENWKVGTSLSWETFCTAAWRVRTFICWENLERGLRCAGRRCGFRANWSTGAGRAAHDRASKKRSRARM